MMLAEDCPKIEQHTPCPRGYLAWHEWAEKMTKTHRQIRCDGCDLLTIWVPKSPRTRSKAANDQVQARRRAARAR